MTCSKDKFNILSPHLLIFTRVNKKACPRTAHFEQYQGQAINTYTCGTTLLRRTSALSRRMLTHSSPLTPVQRCRILSPKRFDSTLNGPFISLHLYPASTCPNSL
jgi:hypothetical protein